MLQVSIYRYNPEQDNEPFMQDVQVDTGGKDSRRSSKGKYKAVLIGRVSVSPIAFL